MLLTAIGGLTFGVSGLSAHCGTCGVGDADVAEHSCPISCESECCAESGDALVGVVVDVNPETRMVMVEHDEIPGVMEATTKGFAVPESYDLTNLTTGCHITARLVQDNDEYLIKLIEVTEPATT